MFALRKFLDRFAGRSAVMGIVNVTGDSFSEGIYSTPDSAVDRAEQLLADGADLLDVGAESTRPGASEVSVQNEIHRLIPVIEIIMRRHPGVVLSIDTRHAETADAALSAGAGIINDVSMLNFSPGMAEVVAKYSDFAIVTSDNPRTEEPGKIIEDIVKGIDGSKNNYEIIENRPAAIRHAMDIAEKNDIIILAGKGHETYQEINGVKHYLDEREVVAAYLEEMR